MRALSIGGNSVTPLDNWKYSKARDSRAIFSCTVIDYEPSVDEEVVFNDSADWFQTADEEPFKTADGVLFMLPGEAVFKGVVMSTAPIRDGSAIYYDVDAVDYSRIADYRITSFVAYNKTAAEIINSLS